MIKNVGINELNRRVAKTLAICSLAMIALLLLDVFGIYNFSRGLMYVIGYIGLFVCLSPIVLVVLNVPDEFLKYYMFTCISVLISAMACFNDIGIFLTFMVVPVLSLLYFNKRFTLIMTGITYVLMFVSVYINCDGKLERTAYGWTHLETFRAYMIGFTIEYIIMALFIYQIVKRMGETLQRERDDALVARSQEYKYELLTRETKDIIFEYNIPQKLYSANRSIYSENKGEAVILDNLRSDETMQKHPALLGIFDQLVNPDYTEDTFSTEIDLCYEKDGEQVPLWYEMECFIVRENDKPVTIIGKLHNSTPTKMAQQNMEKQRMSDMYLNTIQQHRNSIYEQAMSKGSNFTEADFAMLSHGHQFLARTLDNLKYAENLRSTLDQVLESIATYFHVDRICVLETSLSEGSNLLNYQWNSKPENVLVDFFPTMTTEEIDRITKAYDSFGYLEINPSHSIMMTSDTNDRIVREYILKSLLGTQLWIPTLSDGKYTGAVLFDKYDTTPYTIVDKFLLSEVVNLLSAYVTRLNAEEANRAKSEFLSTMSHEIRTPMNAIVGLTEVALREEMTPSMRKSLKTVQSSAFGLLALINDILDFSKIEAGKIELVSEKFHSLSLINDVFEIVKARNAEKLKLILDLPDNLPSYLYGDLVRIKQVMINFCTNAIKYTDSGSVTLKVAVDKVDENNCNFKFSVTDTGIGIRKEDLTKIFKSYSQVDTKINHHKEGTGLGLAISKQLIDLMNGSVAVESEYGKGSTFSFVIPLEVKSWKSAGKLEDFHYDEKEDSEESKKFTAPEALILVVDDTEINLTVVEALLKPVQLKIEKARNGVEAIEMTKEKKYDLILMDHFMPVMDGVEATEGIRNMVENPNRRTPIIALTADAVSGVREELLNRGMDDFLTKPIIIQKMYTVLAKWLPKEKVIY